VFGQTLLNFLSTVCGHDKQAKLLQQSLNYVKTFFTEFTVDVFGYKEKAL
jgi:hypothetical protein